MTGEDLYREVRCSRCGNMKLKTASFCPHCGHVTEEHWWDRLMDRLRPGEGAAGGRPTQIAVVTTLIGLAIASFFLYNAIQTESLRSLIVAVLTLIFALRSWFATRSRTEEAGEDVSVSEPEEFEEIGGEASCDNCGARVDASATECPNCGMKFE